MSDIGQAARLVGSELAQFGSQGFGGGLLSPGRSHRIECLVVNDQCAGNEITQSAILLVTEHCDQANAIHPRQNIHSSHQVASDAFD